jgi:hypothetical protein
MQTKNKVSKIHNIMIQSKENNRGKRKYIVSYNFYMLVREDLQMKNLNKNVKASKISPCNYLHEESS